MAESASSKERAVYTKKEDWADKKNVCYKLYVEQKKTPTDIVKYFAALFKVDEKDLPQAFARQFKNWGFPHRIRKLTKEEEPIVAARLRELWEQNVLQKDIKQIIADEGYYVNHHVFSRLWAQGGLTLRSPGGHQDPTLKRAAPKRKAGEITGEVTDAENQNIDPALASSQDGTFSTASSGPRIVEPQQQQQHTQGAADSQDGMPEHTSSRKRRRRQRGVDGVASDAPDPGPRYASETTLDECKAYLNLTNELYNSIRDTYETIAEDLSIIKKTQCNAGVWEEGKRRLIQRNAHLSAVLHPFQPDQEHKAIALECLCNDVLKRMRSYDKVFTVPGANVCLSINPAESKAIRQSLYDILKADNFQTRRACSNEHWAELRQQWYATSDVLQHAITEQTPDKLRAIERLVKEALKRYHDDRTKAKGTKKSKPLQQGPGPGPAWAGSAPKSKQRLPANVAPSQAPAQSTQPAPATLPQPPSTSSPTLERHWPEIHESHVHTAVVGRYPVPESGNLIATVAQATGDIDFGPDIASITHALQHDPSAPQNHAPTQTTSTNSVPAYFRLAPESRLSLAHPRMWLAKMGSSDIQALHAAALSKAGGALARIVRVDGVMRDGQGGEDRWLVESQDELEAYLAETGEKATFIVRLES